jgi:two-component sensor histidine kinase
MKADATKNAEVKQVLEESQRRVRSIALIHEYLYGTEHLDRIDFAQYASQIVSELHTEFLDQPARISVNMAVEPTELGIHRAVPCALILNELVSNAFKHAFTGCPSGTLRVSFHKSAPDRLRLIVEDDGAGAPMGILERDSKSLGLRIVRILTKQLEGSLAQEPCAGTRFVLEFPAGTSCHSA